MERLMLLQLQAQNCEVEAWLNGVLVARAGVARPQVSVPVHEYALAGRNEIELVIAPVPFAPLDLPSSLQIPQLARQTMRAVADILLPRVGAAADDQSARSLARCEWMAAEGEPIQLPARQAVEVDLPLKFPRWRWLDAPQADAGAALHLQVYHFVQQLALDLARGQTEGFLAATRLRNEELALAYQREPQHEIARLRSQLERLHAAKRLQWLSLQREGLRLRPQAGGRLLECLDASGEPALRTVPDDNGTCLAFPLRLAVVESKLYVLR